MGGARSRTALWVSPVSNLAGVARHIIDVARVGLPGWRLEIVAPEGPLVERLRERDATVHTANIGVEASTLDATRELRRVIKAVRPDVVHTHLARADILAALATHGLPVTLVSTEHHISPDRTMFHASLNRARVMEWVHHVRLKRFAGLIAVSASTRRDMERYWRPGRPVTVIRNGVDRPAEPVRRDPGLRFLSLARLSKEKNIDMVLRAFAHIRANHPVSRLTIAGSGPERAPLARLAADLGVDDAVAFPGFVDPDEAMATHDVILQPSKSDNLSYTLLDAVAQGMGVAASPIGGNPEILPARCMAPLDDDATLTRVAIEQALDVSARPTLPEAIPTVAGMVQQVAAVYAGLGAR